FISTEQADEWTEEPTECEGCPSCTGEAPAEHANIAADVADAYVIARIIDRVEAEADLLQRSILVMREEGELEPEIIAELGP
ncbi:DUF4365 domain-containing protein, partial [Micromonospora aurantiaca]|nr:DUF4365 domain-containing protein [Micromonospora aurantiaca]